MIIYKANLYGIDDSFNLNSNDIRSEIRKSYKQKLTTIFVVKYLNGYKEILTGKYFAKYTKVYNPKKGLGVIPTSKPIFVIDDLKTLNPIDMKVAERLEVQNYIKDNSPVILKSTLDILEDNSYANLYDAKVRLNGEEKTQKILRRMK